MDTSEPTAALPPLTREQPDAGIVAVLLKFGRKEATVEDVTATMRASLELDWTGREDSRERVEHYLADGHHLVKMLYQVMLNAEQDKRRVQLTDDRRKGVFRPFH